MEERGREGLILWHSELEIAPEALSAACCTPDRNRTYVKYHGARSHSEVEAAITVVMRESGFGQRASSNGCEGVRFRVCIGRGGIWVYG